MEAKVGIGDIEDMEGFGGSDDEESKGCKDGRCRCCRKNLLKGLLGCQTFSVWPSISILSHVKDSLQRFNPDICYSGTMGNPLNKCPVYLRLAYADKQSLLWLEWSESWTRSWRHRLVAHVMPWWVSAQWCQSSEEIQLDQKQKNLL